MVAIFIYFIFMIVIYYLGLINFDYYRWSVRDNGWLYMVGNGKDGNPLSPLSDGELNNSLMIVLDNLINYNVIELFMIFIH